MILTNDDTISEKCKSIRVHGMVPRALLLRLPWLHEPLRRGAGSVLRIKLRKQKEWNARRNSWLHSMRLP